MLHFGAVNAHAVRPGAQFKLAKTGEEITIDRVREDGRALPPILKVTYSHNDYFAITHATFQTRWERNTLLVDELDPLADDPLDPGAEIEIYKD